LEKGTHRQLPGTVPSYALFLVKLQYGVSSSQRNRPKNDFPIGRCGSLFIVFFLFCLSDLTKRRKSTGFELVSFNIVQMDGALKTFVLPMSCPTNNDKNSLRLLRVSFMCSYRYVLNLTKVFMILSSEFVLQSVET
jgi:hypothetical protein